MKSFFSYIVLALIIWSVVCVVRPYWDRYNIAMELEVVAIYGTKHEIDDIKKQIKMKISENDWPFEVADVIVKKNEDRDVEISITYPDKIKIFGFTVKSLEMTIEKEARYVNPVV
ncbi:MAG: hypothetical protein EHM45_00215 [Desulfobacteraceae bacterium]|nr:MAG: hypothetical protein EHM45_00215 [Desulfobacteraceae bacterium]